MAVGVPTANRLGTTTTYLEAGIGLVRRMPAPGDSKVGDVTVMIEGVGDNGTGGHPGVLEFRGPALGHGVGVDAGGRRHDQITWLTGAWHPPAVLNDTKTERPAEAVIQEEILLVL